MTRAPMFLSLLLLCAGVPAQEAGEGEMLYQNHCTACHESTVHVRERTKVAGPSDLAAYVQRWSDYLDLGWGDAERGAVMEYLNLTFYGFFDDSAPPPPSK